MYQQPNNQPPQEYAPWQQPSTQYPPQQWQPPQQPWQQVPMMPPQSRPVRMQVKVACLICFGLSFILAMMGVPFLTLVAGLSLLTAFVLVFLI